MPADITPKQARSETIENLVAMANLYRVGSGAHTVVTNEIQRRAEAQRFLRKIFLAFILGAIGFVFWLLRTFFS
jgi:hypothetical protein